MHEITYAESCTPPRAVCLGLPLRPYSLGHEILLLAKQNPFLTLTETGFNAMPEDQQRLALTRAADICSMTWAENHWQPVTWLERRRYRRVYARWTKHIAGVTWPLEIAHFRIHLAAGRTLLPTLSSENDDDVETYKLANKGEELEGGRHLGAPLAANLTNYAIGRLHLSHAVAMDFPFSQLCNLYFAHLETKGALAIENQNEAKTRADLLRRRTEIVEGHAAARAAWAACTTDAERLAAIAAHPRLRDAGMFPEEVARLEWAAATDDASRTAAIKANPWLLDIEPQARQYAETKGILQCLP